VPVEEVPLLGVTTPEALVVATGLLSAGEDWWPVAEDDPAVPEFPAVTVLVVPVGIVRARPAVVAPTPTKRAANVQLDSRLTRLSPVSRDDPAGPSFVEGSKAGRRVLRSRP